MSVWVLTMVQEMWVLLAAMAPYLLFGFAVAGVLSVVVTPETVERHLGGRGFWPVFKAALVGVPLPLCSCGVIPVAASLRKHGSSRGATASFLLSTPQTGVDSILVTYSLLGPVMAVFRPFAAFLTGILGGLLTDGLTGSARNGIVPEAPPEKCTDACCGHGRKAHPVVRAVRHGFVTLPRDISGAMLVGMAVAGIISILIPDDFFAGRIGTGIGAIVFMMLLGIPIYVCATASVPIAAALIAKGVSPGAALAFLIAGPATNAATIAALWKMLGRRAMWIYLGTIAFSAVFCGVVLDRIFEVRAMPHAHVHGEMLPAWISNASAAVLLIILLAALLPPRRQAGYVPGGSDKKQRGAL